MLSIGATTLTVAELDVLTRSLGSLGMSVETAIGSKQHAKLVQGILGSMGGGGVRNINATIEEIMGAKFGKTVAEAIAKPVGDKDGPLAKAFAQLFQRLGGTGLSNVPGMSALGGMWTMRPISQILSTLSGASIVTVAAGLAGFMAAIGAAVLAIHEFGRSVREGTDLYNRASRLGISPEKLYQIDRMASAAGMRPEKLEELILAGEFRKGTPITFEGLMMGARRMGDSASLQQLMNQKGLIEWQLRQSSGRGDEVNQISGRFKELSVLSSDISSSWGMIKTRIAGAFTDTTGLKVTMTGIADVMNKISRVDVTKAVRDTNAAFMPGIGSVLGLLPEVASALVGPKASTNLKRFPFLGQTALHPNANRWERLGFATGPGGDPYLHTMQEIARNTKKMSDQHSTASALGIAARALSTSLMSWLHHGSANLP